MLGNACWILHWSFPGPTSFSKFEIIYFRNALLVLPNHPALCNRLLISVVVKCSVGKILSDLCPFG